MKKSLITLFPVTKLSIGVGSTVFFSKNHINSRKIEGNAHEMAEIEEIWTSFLHAIAIKCIFQGC